MSIKRVTPVQAAQMMEQGWTFVDVRSVPEFELGHPSGAYNVPLLRRTAAGLAPNGDFLAVVTASFDKDHRLILGCKSGKRSMRAAAQLVAAGYDEVTDMEGGFLGDGKCAGWRDEGLGEATAPAKGRSYAELVA